MKNKVDISDSLSTASSDAEIVLKVCQTNKIEAFKILIYYPLLEEYEKNNIQS